MSESRSRQRFILKNLYREINLYRRGNNAISSDHRLSSYYHKFYKYCIIS